MIESLALHKDDVDHRKDTTMPDHKEQRRVIKDAAKEFLEAVYPDDYDPAAPFKRKAPAKKEPAAKKAKVEPINPDTLDMGAYVEKKTVAKLTVVQLKGYLNSIDIDTAGMKKADLVNEVYKFYEK